MEFDSIVIGAGPAGTFSALKLTEKGIHTALIEEHSQIGTPVHCGECLSDYALKNTGVELNSNSIAAKVKGVKVIFPSGKECISTEPGYVLHKEKFEQSIAEQAKRKGAEIFSGTRITELELNKEKNKWNLTSNSDELNPKTGNSFSSKLLIDATGVSQFTSRKLALNKPSETVIGFQYLAEDCYDTDYLEFYIWPKLAPHGYLWVIPKGNGKANVGLTTTHKNKAKQFCDEFMKLKGFTKIQKSFGGLISHSGPLKKTFSNNLMLVGDAAGFTSPMFEGGTHLSLKSAEMMSEIAEKAIQKNDFSEKTLNEYELLWKKEFPPYKKLLKGKEKFYSYNEEELNKLSKYLPYELNGIKTADKMIYGLKLLMHNPSIVFKGVASAFDSFKYSTSKFYGW
ncbi:MAG: NAD(P)/FAD-dependent oxidoreductase [Candidatus Diapherotrites archaeon]